MVLDSAFTPAIAADSLGHPTEIDADDFAFSTVSSFVNPNENPPPVGFGDAATVDGDEPDEDAGEAAGTGAGAGTPVDAFVSPGESSCGSTFSLGSTHDDEPDFVVTMTSFFGKPIEDSGFLSTVVGEAVEAEAGAVSPPVTAGALVPTRRVGKTDDIDAPQGAFVSAGVAVVVIFEIEEEVVAAKLVGISWGARGAWKTNGGYQNFEEIHASHKWRSSFRTCTRMNFVSVITCIEYVLN